MDYTLVLVKNSCTLAWPKLKHNLTSVVDQGMRGKGAGSGMNN